jgi:hypothetical protein
MSISTGTATDYNDLLARLVTFLTTDATLTGLGQNWTLESSNTTSYTDAHGDTVVREVILKAPGLSSTEAIFVELQAFYGSSGATAYWNWRMLGATGYNSGQPWNAQPGVSPDAFVHLWNASIPYTFIANGQRVVVIAQVGSVFESAYLGKFLPYGQPSQYPYPVYIAGTSNSRQLPYSDTTSGLHFAFFDPSIGYAYWIDGSWQTMSNTYYTSAGKNIWPYVYGNTQQPTWVQPNLDGSYPLFPCRLEMVPATFPPGPTTIPQPNAMGELDGVFFVPGVGLTSGSAITIGGATYTVVQNVFRTADNSFAAILEA